MDVNNNISFVTGTVEGQYNVTGGKNIMENIGNVVNQEVNVKSNITGGTNTMENIGNVKAQVLSTVSVKLKRAVYSETKTKKIITRIKEGATSHDILVEFNVKERSTIKRWLDLYFTKKKAVRDKVYALLLENDRKAKASTALKVFKEPPAVEITFEEWFGGPAEYDILIDSHMPEFLQAVAQRYATTRNLSYAISRKGTPITWQAILFGKPAIITNNPSIIDFCQEDCIPYHNVVDIVKMHSEKGDDDFARTETFDSFVKGSNGNLSTHRELLIQEFAEHHALSVDTLDLFLEKRAAPDIFTLKENQVFRVVCTDKLKRMCYCWRFQLRGGIFYEVGYKEGDIAVKAMVITA